MFTVSLVLHLVGVLVVCWCTSLSREKSKAAETDQWIVDVDSVLLSAVSGSNPSPVTPDTPPPVQKSENQFISDHEAAVQKNAGDAEPAMPAEQGQSETVSTESRTVPFAESAGNPARTPPVWPSMNSMNPQAIVAQLRSYHQASIAAVNGMVRGALSPEESRMLEGTSGRVVVAFHGESIDSLMIETTSDRLRDVLQERIRWETVPLPRKFHLPIVRFSYSISFSHGRVGVTAAPI